MKQVRWRKPRGTDGHRVKRTKRVVRVDAEGVDYRMAGGISEQE